MTCSCSYNVDEPLFLQILAEAAADAHAHVTILEKRMQGRDHPVLADGAGDLLPEVRDLAERLGSRRASGPG